MVRLDTSTRRRILVKLFLSLSVALVAAALLLGASAAAPTGAPASLSPYGGLIWNLDALVGDFYGGAHTCLRVRSFEIHRCSSPRFNDGDYRATFAKARGSRFRAVSRSSSPNLGN